MKKLLIIVIFLLILFTGCNKQIIDLKYKFDSVHLYEAKKCYKIKSWRDYDDSDQLQVILEDGTTIVLHSTDCALIKGDCPFCEENNNE
jgi:hypothetical protein